MTCPIRLAAAVLITALVAVTTSSSQLYREWRDTTLPPERTPQQTGSLGFPLGMFFYHYENDRPVVEIWPYVQSIGLDHIHYIVEKGVVDGRNRFLRYDSLLRAAPAGHGVLPWIGYNGYDNRPALLSEAEQAREVIFYPFDSSQMRDLGVQEHAFLTYAFDSTHFNPNYPVPGQEDWMFREAVYNPPMANQVVATDIVFNYDSTSTDPPNKHEIFLRPNQYARYDTVKDEWVDGDRFLTHRSPHFIVLTGHLFDDPTPVADNTNLLELKVWYEVKTGQTYYDSSNVLQTAGADLRFLYKTLYVTRGELKPSSTTEPEWDEYRESIKRIDFRREGMGGPTDTLVTAQDIDIEVIYLGGERVALRSVALRDSIANLLQTTTTEALNYKAAVLREIDTLVLDQGTGSLHPSVYNLYLSDEPHRLSTVGLRTMKAWARQSYQYANGDSLSSFNGWATPHAQWLGDADWSAVGTYLAHPFHNLGSVFGIHRASDSVPIRDIPSVRQHNGGRFHIPEFFDFDSLGSASYKATLPGRIDTMELLWQYGRLGGAAPGQGLEKTWKYHDNTRLVGMHQVARYARQLGRPFLSYVGPGSSFRIGWDEATSRYDTIATHRYERAELRATIRAVLAHGAQGITFYQFQTYPWIDYDKPAGTGHPPRDTNALIMFTETGLSNRKVGDTTENFITWHMMRAGHSDDTLLSIPGVFFGHRDTHKELKESVAWIQRIGPKMASLRWRDAYSMHWQTRRPNVPQDTDRAIRPVPSNEIVGGITARHPITGFTDPNYATYVELGLFETVIDTTGGVRDRMKDTNYVFVVNRRVFETGNYDSADIVGLGSTYTAATRALLDTLSETRTIELQLRLVNPDTSNQYNRFVRIREVEPDLAPLPLIGIRQPLDTIVVYDDSGWSNVRLTLGAGRAALLQITYAQPDVSIAEGILDRNGQRKIVYDPLTQRYHATYHRYDSALGDRHVFYRRSLPVDTTGSILWEPMEWPVSEYMDDADDPRTQNAFPSITFRYLPGGAQRVTIVWTAHPNASGHSGEREVLLRDIEYVPNPGDDEVMMAIPIRSVAFHNGLEEREWGTPVVSSAGFGEYVAWSDSVEGIVVRGRVLDTSIFSTVTWTPIDSVGRNWSALVAGMTRPGRYPSMPPFTHRGINDSSAALVWQQPEDYGYVGIPYVRMFYSAAGPSISAQPIDDVFLSENWYLGPSYQYLHPSIDQTQDALGRVMEGVTYERHFFLGNDWNYEVYFRAVEYDTAAQKSFLVGGEIHNLDLSSGTGPDYGYIYPVATSENQVMTLDDTAQTPLFDLVMLGAEICSDCIKTLEARWIAGTGAGWVNHVNVWGSPRVRHYWHGGLMPTGSASDGRLTDRYTTLYANVGDSVLRTSRQFFARARPGGYNAQGIQVAARLDDALGLGVAARLHDVWMSDATKSADVGMRLPARPDSLSDLLTRLESNMFTTSDSVDIGLLASCELSARDSSGAIGERLDYVVELVDSSTGGVVAVLDSIALDVTSRRYAVRLDTTLDLLSGTYYVRGRISSNVIEGNRALSDTTYDWSMTQLNQAIASLTSKRVHRLDDEAGNGLRLSAQPNPFAQETEIRFSIPRGERISLRVFDAAGREVATLIDGEEMEHGRYAAVLESANLPNGSYIVELRMGEERITTQVVLRR